MLRLACYSKLVTGGVNHCFCADWLVRQHAQLVFSKACLLVGQCHGGEYLLFSGALALVGDGKNPFIGLRVITDGFTSDVVRRFWLLCGLN